MAKAYSYVRFSTPEQIKGDSLRRQTELSEKYALENGLELDTTHNLSDRGISAYDKSNITKGALGQFLKIVNEGKIPPGSFLLVESLDRLSRAQVLDALQVFLGILNAGITIVTLADNALYSKQSTNDNWTSLITSIVIMSRATEESATKSRRIRASWDNKRAKISEKRLTARCPYWMKPATGENGFLLIPEREKVVKKIIQMAKDGIGNSTIVKRLNSEKVKPFSNKTNGWHPSYIQKMLRSPSLYGELRLSLQRDGEITPIETPISNYYPAVISKDEWLFINASRANRKTAGGTRKGKNLSNLFSGLLICGYCGHSMVMGGQVTIKPNGKRRENKYVACSNGRRGLGCHFIAWDYHDLEQQILEYCKSLDFSAVLGLSNVFNKELENAQKRVVKITHEIQSIEKKIKNLLLALEIGDSTPKAVLKHITENEFKLAKLKDNDLKIAEATEKQLIIASTNITQRQNDIIELLKQLETKTGTELLDLRIRLSENIKRSVEKIELLPGGMWYEPKEQNQKKMNNLPIAPNRENRTMSIHFKNGETRFIMDGMVMDVDESTG
jgi:DNA invertase Pin-like site-specific DNA recombinase